MYILGISALYHDSAAALVKDGEIVAAVQEERFTRVKHDNSIPYNSINYCLETAGIELNEIDYVIYYENPVRKLDRWVYSACVLGNDNSFHSKSLDKRLTTKFGVPEGIRSVFGEIGKEDKLYISNHHLSHAASALYASPYEEAAVLVIDAVGEWETNTLSHGDSKGITSICHMEYPNSIGLLYSAVTAYCGFKVNSGEYKLMGLAPYGTPRFSKLIQSEMIEIKRDGSYFLNMDYFDFIDSDKLFNEKKWSSLFGVGARLSETEIEIIYMDIAASIQKILEEVVYLQAEKLKLATKSRKLVMAGGVALNCSSNGKLLKSELFEHIWIQPASGDAGTALGAALWMNAQKTISTSPRVKADIQKGTYLGPEFSIEDIRNYLDVMNYKYYVYDRDNASKVIADCINKGKVVGLFQGRMEYGPRSLGCRSIIGDPRTQAMQEKINLKIKYRESFRPFAPAVLEEHANDYFDLKGVTSPYMLLITEVNQSRLVNNESKLDDFNGDMISYLKQDRSEIAAVTHVDYSARVQTVNKNTNPYFYEIIEEFNDLSGCPVVVNTSFNVRGEPIVCTPEDAYRCFMRTEMDVLVLENAILYKEEQPEFENSKDWMDEYELD